MESLIQIINKLQDVFSVVGGDTQLVDLPQIVVVGTQSSGKSSVLESLVGKSFLPRGTGVVTRAPLVIQMIRYSDDDKDKMLKNNDIGQEITDWAEFLHKPKKLFFDFDDVCKEIEFRTDFLAGENEGITNEQIVLKVYTKLYNLTFVDLPGITKVPVGDQPEDIDEQIHKLIISYAKQSNSIILAVVPANMDPSTSESLQIAKKLDPEGSRTIAVVTKLDLIDQGTLHDTTELLCGKRIPVKLGIVGVVNRSQQDINENKSMDATLASEKEFLKKNYPDIYLKHGNKSLARTLQSVLITHIRKVYPKLKEELENMKKKMSDKLLTLETPDNKISFIIGLLKNISKSYEGTMNGDGNDISIDEISGGASIAQIIEHKYLKKINAIDPLQDLSDENISTVLLNTSGINKSAFVNEKALQKILCRQLKNLIEPSLDCVDLVRNEMSKIFDSIDVRYLDILKRFPRFNEDVRKVFEGLLDENVIDIKDFIMSYIESYQESIDTTNMDFILEMVKSVNIQDCNFMKTSMVDCETEYDDDEEEKKIEVRKMQMLQQLLSGLSDSNKSLDNSEQVKLHKDLSHCYFVFIRKMVRDFVPKRIKHKMINCFLNYLDTRLNEEVFQTYLIEKKIDQVFLKEGNDYQEDRENTEKKLEAIKMALKNMIDIQYF